MRYLGLLLMLLSLVRVSEAKWALVVRGEVQETWDRRPKFHHAVMDQIYPVADDVVPGWRYSEGVWLPPKTQAELDREAFDRQRLSLLEGSVRSATAIMSASWKYKLTGSLTNSYPDPAQPLCVTEDGEHLTLSKFMMYIQEREDDGAANPELQQLRQTAKNVRKYFRNLKGE